MSRTGRYWLFFVIVAVGLALSWGQVGRKTERALSEQPVTFLQHEPGCRPRSAPCAAVGRDRALIVGPAGDGLRIVTTGFGDLSLVSAGAQQIGRDGKQLTETLFAVGRDAWSLTGIDAAAQTLRVQVRTTAETTVAEFPLAPDRAAAQ